VPSKTRPALVVQSDFYNRRIANVVVAAITSNLTNQGDGAHWLIDVTTADGRPTGLRQNSLVSCNNLAVIPPNEFDRKIGELSDLAMQQVDVCLRVALGL